MWGGYWGPHYHYHYGGGNYNEERSSCLVVFVIIAIFLILMLIIGSTYGDGVPKNTKTREALTGVVHKTEWYKDDIGWISNRSALINGLDQFYKKTGVQPYILMVPYSSTYWNGQQLNNTVADEYLENVYSSTFSDEGHFIFAYFQCANDSKSEMDGTFRYVQGYSVNTIMDDEALDIFWGYFEKNYYDTSISMENMISKTFMKTAESIMSKPTNGFDVLKVILIVAGVVLVFVIIYKTKANKNQREKEKEEFTKDILNKPLETFGKEEKSDSNIDPIQMKDDKLKNLEDKYKDE